MMKRTNKKAIDGKEVDADVARDVQGQRRVPMARKESLQGRDLAEDELPEERGQGFAERLQGNLVAR